MNKIDLSNLYSKVTKMTWNIDDDFDKVDKLELVRLLEKVAETLSEIIEGNYE